MEERARAHKRIIEQITNESVKKKIIQNEGREKKEQKERTYRKSN